MAYGKEQVDSLGKIASDNEKYMKASTVDTNTGELVFDLMNEGGKKIDLFEEDPINQVKKMQEELKLQIEKNNQ